MHKKRLTLAAAALCLVFMGALAWIWPEKTSAPQQSHAAGITVADAYFAQNLWEKNVPEGTATLRCGTSTSKGGQYKYDPSYQVKAVRLWGASRIMWSQVETSNNVYDWRCFDIALSRASSLGADVMYTFGGVPLWANGTATPTPACANPGGTAFGCAGVPTNATARANFMNEWKSYVSNVVAHAGTKITYWEMWNESNDPIFWQGPNGYPQVGSAKDLAEMSAYAIDIIKAANPNAKILNPAFATSDGAANKALISSYLTELKARGKDVDIIAFHAYTVSNNTQAQTPEATLVNLAQTIKQAWPTKPIFMTEGGWKTDALVTTSDLRRSYLVKSLVINASAGIARHYWYTFSGPVTPPESRWGTQSDANTAINPSGVAYQEVQKWLSGATFVKQCYADAAQTWHCPITRSSPAGYVGEIIWNSGKTTSVSKGSYTYMHTTTAITSALGATFSVGITPVLVDNQGPPPTPPPAPTPPTITSFTANPAIITVGQTTTFSWATANTTTCSITPGGPTNITTKTWQPVAFTTTGVKTYTLTCKNSAGTTVTKTASVTVNAAVTKPTNVVLSANKTTVTGNTSVTFNWTSVGATNCKLDPGAFTASGSNGSKAVTITATTTFTATCSNAVGSTASNSVKVTFSSSPPATLPDPTISKFTVTPASIASGETTTLTWASVDASSCTIASSIDSVAKPYPVSGTFTTASLNSAVSYTLTCKNTQNKTVFKQLQVAVAGKTTPAPAAAKAEAIPSPQPSNTTNNRVSYTAPNGQTVIDAQNSSTVIRGQLISLDITTVTDSAKASTVQRAEFYDGEALVDTVEMAPFALNTNKISVGSHSLTQRTYYRDGSSSSQSQLVEVLGAETVRGPNESLGSKTNLFVLIGAGLVAVFGVGVAAFVLLKRRALKMQVLNTYPAGQDPTQQPTALPQYPSNSSPVPTKPPQIATPEQPAQIISPTITPQNDIQPPPDKQQ